MQRAAIKIGLALLVGLLAVGPAGAEESWYKESKADRDARMQWWRDARFGMFIHWGLYAVPAGEWKGKEVPGHNAEWIMNSANIPVDEYEPLAKQFNPVKYDPAKWAALAKKAGIKYVVITSKHHDGYCLFDSKATNYDVVDGSPYGKDLLKPLADACRKEGIKFCCYYSIMDWHHPAFTKASEKAFNPMKVVPERKAEYVAYMKQQLKELIDNYGVEVLWFDGEWPDWWTEPDGRDLYTYLRSLKPSLVINNRIGKGRKGMDGMNKGDQEYAGDFGTPEQEIPATGLAGVDWESCMTMNDTWGFKRNDHNWKSTEKLVRNIIDIASKGGNYLLNVGPTAEGEIPAASVERLEEIGKWMEANGESIYGTQASPFKQTPWGRCTQKKLADGKTRLYLHAFTWPKDGKLVIPPLANKVIGACLLEGGKKLDVTTSASGVAISLPAEMPNKLATVVALDIAGEPQVVTVDPYENETPAERDARMKWWREARFGLFIHWGVYSVPAGTYQGKQIPSIGEWIMNRGKIPVAEYKSFAKQFNPVKYDADQWVQLAKEAGMKYIVITSKHHDGFAMFDSKVTDWTIKSATPFGRDPLKELAAACQKHGLKLGFYYSQAQDWCHPGGAAAGGHWDKAQDGDMTEYIRKIAVPQVREILSNYGPIAVLWWDTPTDMTKERAEMLLPLLRLQPGIIHNNRLGGGYRGDTDTPEQFIPATGMPGRDWEACMTMNDTWGYKSYDDHWKSTETLIRNLVDIASKGGNYLLNVGPTSEGQIPQPSVDRLKEVGRWMKVNGEAVHATAASPFKYLPFGRATKKLGDGEATLYLHVFNWPEDGKLFVPGLKNSVATAYLLADPAKQALRADKTADGVVVTVPGAATDPICSVVVLKVKGTLDVEPMLPTQHPDGSLKLQAADAICHGKEIKYESGHQRDNIGFWTKANEWVEWKFQISKPGTFTVNAEIASQGTGAFEVSVGNQKLPGKAVKTGDFGTFKAVTLGTLELPAGKHALAVKPVKAGWSPINLKSVTLKPAK
jgi:alpha-L-fucosidase